MLKKIMHTCTRKNKKILFTHVKAAENTSPYYDHDDYYYDNKIIFVRATLQDPNFKHNRNSEQEMTEVDMLDLD